MDVAGGATSSGVRCDVLGRFSGFHHKIMIKIQESSPSIMVIRNLWSARV